jgi:hypothetical protein
MALTLVSTVTVGSGGAASIQFTNIPQTGKDLLVLCSIRDGNASVVSSTFLQLNGSNSNFSRVLLRGTGSTVASTISASGQDFARTSADSSTASTFGNGSFYIANYTVSQNKSVSVDSVSENNATAADQQITAGLWSNTAAVTSLALTPFSSFLQHSTASLYIIS